MEAEIPYEGIYIESCNYFYSSQHAYVKYNRWVIKYTKINNLFTLYSHSNHNVVIVLLKIKSKLLIH